MFARTKRLLLRPGWREDARRLHDAWNDPVIRRALLDTPVSRSLAEAEAFLMRDRDPLHPYFLLFARTGAAPRLIGGCGLHPATGGAGPEARLDFWIARPFWGLGFATEAAGAALRAARAGGLAPITARADEGNSAAQHVLAKLGFRPTGTAGRRPCPVDGPARTARLFRDSGLTPARADSALQVYRDRPLAA